MTRRPLRLLCLLAFCLFSLTPTHAWAATDTVTNLNDSGPGSLRQTIATAANDDTIVFASGVTGTITLQSELQITVPVTITGPGAANLALSTTGRSVSTPFGVLAINSASVTVSGLTIENGGSMIVGPEPYEGGGIAVASGASADITNCVISGNDAGFGGGGVYNDGTATLTDCTVSGNVSNEFGGGLYNDTGATLTLNGCFITSNGADAQQYGGSTGAGALQNQGTLTMVNCVVTRNTAFSGYGGSDGGIINYGALTITGSSFTDNGANYGGGALVQYTDTQIGVTPSLTLTNDIFYGDVQGITGGNAEINIGGGTATASYCDIGEALGSAGDGVTDGGHNLDQSPAFENPPSNLQIGRTSPCLGAGTAGAPDYLNTDITGAPRATPNPAIGAYDAAALGNGSPADTLTLASSSPNNTSPYGQTAAVTATVNPASSGGVAPTGTVTFTVNGTAQTPVTVTNGTAALPASALTPGMYTITAAYSGDANYVPSTSSSLTQTVNKAAPTITLTATPNPGTTGQYVTLTATVSPPAGQASGVSAPSGYVTFNGNEQQLLVNGVATLQISYYQATTVTFTAVYDGDGNYTTATATPVQEQITGNTIYGTSVALSSSAEPSAAGQSVTFTATLNLSYVPSGTPAPTGTITFTVNGDNVNDATQTSPPVAVTEVNGHYQAQYTTSSLPVGQGQVSANYSGDSHYGSSGTGTVLQAVYSGTTPTTITLTPATSSVAYNSPATVTATVTPSPGPGGFASGEYVIFTVDGQQSQFQSALTNGVATYTTSSLAPGPHTISAIYAGDSTYAGSQSNTVNVTITGGNTATNTTLISSPNPSASGQQVVVIATVAHTSGTTPPSGNVVFTVDGTAQPATYLNFSGQAELTLSGLSVGSHSITAAYLGDPTYAASASAILTQTVAANGGSTASKTMLISSVNPSAVGQSVTFTATAAPNSGPGTPTGYVFFTLNGEPSPAVILNASGQARITTSIPMAGSYTLTAVYSGDATFAGSTSNTVTQQVNGTTSTGTPTANSQSLSTNENTAVNITLTGTDPDSPPLALTYAIATQPAHGTLTGTAPNLTYTPSANYSGSDSFTFTVSNGTNTSSPATISLTVIGTPMANSQSVSTAFNTAKAITLTGSDPNNPPQTLTYTVASQPAHGTLTGTAPNLTYTSTSNYHGGDSFTFTVKNSSGLTSSAATVTLNVATGTPTATPQTVTTAEGTAAGITLSGPDPDVPALPLTYAVASQPTHGTLSGTAPNLTYTPNAGYFGPDSFTFTASNGTHISTAATVSLTVTQVFVAPTATPQTVSVAFGTATPVTLSGTDPQGEALTYAVASQPTHGTLTGTALSLTYTPTAGYFGPDSFTFTVKDTSGLTSASATVTLNVATGPTGQVATHLSVTPSGPATAGQPVTVTVKALDANNAVVTGYTGTATLTDTDPRANPIAPVSLNNGTGTAFVTFGTAGTQTVTATAPAPVSPAIRAHAAPAGSLTGSGTVTVASNPNALPKIAVTSVLLASGAGGTVTATVTLTDTGVGAASNVRLTLARLGGRAAPLPSPVSLGAGQSQTVTVSFPANTPTGAQTLLLSGADTAASSGSAGAFSASQHVTVP